MEKENPYQSPTPSQGASPPKPPSWRNAPAIKDIAAFVVALVPVAVTGTAFAAFLLGSPSPTSFVRETGHSVIGVSTVLAPCLCLYAMMKGANWLTLIAIALACVDALLVVAIMFFAPA